MDILLGFGVSLLVTVVIGTAIYFIMTLGMKEKTYEEAILEQRQRSEDVLLLGKSARDKQKEKKMKKAGKKVKEKQALEKVASKETSEGISSEETDQGRHHKNEHVGFVEPAAIIIEESAVPQNDESSEHSGKKASQKLVDAEKSDKIVKTGKKDKENVVPNKVEKIPQPKIDKSEKNAKPEKPQTQPAKLEKQEKQAAPSKPAVKEPTMPAAAVIKVEKQASAKPEKPAVVKVEKPSVSPVRKPVQETVVSLPALNAASVPSKNSGKKKKNELTLEQMTASRDGVNANFIEPLVRKAELSRSEIQNLIDLLLNKQQGSETENAEWIEGRQDPMMKLKKAFAEKEKALQEEQEASQAVQNKLKEVRAEANAERSRLNLMIKQFEEKLNVRTGELGATAAKLQHEKQILTQQLQQLKHQMEQEHVLIRQLQEEKGQAQNALQARQQLEHHIAAISAQHQEQETALTQQIALLRQQLAEQQASAQQCEILSAQVAQLQEQLKNAQNSSQGEVHSKQKQLNELKAGKEEIERQLGVALQRESQLNAEFHKLKEGVAQRQAEFEKIAAQAAEAVRLREDNERLSSQVSMMSQLQTELRQLREENESLAAQVTAVTERPAAEGRENGDLAEEKVANAKLLSAQLIHEEAIRDKDVQVEKLLDQAKQAEKTANITIETLKSEINAHKSQVTRLTTEIEQQRRKNDELRAKNYKAMDALNASEKMVQSKMQESDRLVHEATKSVRLEEEQRTRELLQRLFPTLSVDEKVHDQWLKKFSEAITKHISEISSRQTQTSAEINEDQSTMRVELEKQNSQLTAMVTHYKTIIEDTEGMLNKLQLHVEAEESKWRQQLTAKEADLDAVKSECDELKSRLAGELGPQMQIQLRELQDKLAAEEKEKCNLQVQLGSTKESLATIELLKKEQSRLEGELATEQGKITEQSKELVKLRSLVQVGQESLAQEQKLVQQLKDELDKLKDNSPPASPANTIASQNHNGAANGPSSSEVTVSESPIESVSPSPRPVLNKQEENQSDTQNNKKKKKKGWLKKKVGGSKSPQLSPNLSARSEEFMAAEKMDSSA